MEQAADWPLSSERRNSREARRLEEAFVQAAGEHVASCCVAIQCIANDASNLIVERASIKSMDWSSTNLVALPTACPS